MFLLLFRKSSWYSNWNYCQFLFNCNRWGRDITLPPRQSSFHPTPFNYYRKNVGLKVLFFLSPSQTCQPRAEVRTPSSADEKTPLCTGSTFLWCFVTKPVFLAAKQKPAAPRTGTRRFLFLFLFAPPQRPARVSGSAAAPAREPSARLTCAQIPTDAQKQLLPRDKTPPLPRKRSCPPRSGDALGRGRCSPPNASGARAAGLPSPRRGGPWGEAGAAFPLRRPRVLAEPEEGAAEAQPGAAPQAALASPLQGHLPPARRLPRAPRNRLLRHGCAAPRSAPTHAGPGGAGSAAGSPEPPGGGLVAQPWGFVPPAGGCSRAPLPRC